MLLSGEGTKAVRLVWELGALSASLAPLKSKTPFPPQVESLAKYRVIYKPYSRAETEPSVKI